MKASWFKRRTPICFDVGAAGVRASQLVRRNGSWRASDLFHVDLLTGDVPDDVTAGKPSYDRVARLVDQAAFESRELELILAPPEVGFHPLKLPPRALQQSEQRVREALAWEVSREMRTEPGALEIRYWRMPDGHRQGLNVMVVALSTVQATAWFNQFAAAGLRLRGINVSPCVLAHLVDRVSHPAPQDLWGVLDIGHRHSTLTIAIGSTPIYVRSLPHGSARWTARLAKAFEMPVREAEAVKREHGIRVDAGGEAALTPPAATQLGGDIPAVAFGVLRDSLEDLTRAVRLCFTYALQNYSELDVKTLWLAGGGTQLRGLEHYLARQLEIDVRHLRNQAAAETGGLPKFEPAEACALGAALLQVEAA